MASLAGNGDDSQNMQKIKIKFGKEIFEVTISKEKTYANLLDLLPALSGARKDTIKLFGLKSKTGLHESTRVGDMKIFKILKMMGTKEDVLKKEEDKASSATQELNVLNDMDIYELDLDFNKGNIMEKLRDSIAKTEISSRMMNEPRPNFPLLVLDLDHTLLDFDSKSSNFAKMKRPYMHEFLDWSTSTLTWSFGAKLPEMARNKVDRIRVLEPSNPYKILFVLDKECMFRRKSRIIKQVEKRNVRRLNR